MTPLRAALICTLLLTSACSVTPPLVSQSPSLGSQALSGPGDPLYRYEFVPETFVDYLNMESTERGDSVTQELLYSGMVDGALQVTYREYVRDLARPAFQQSATYAFEPGTLITFKGAQVRVLGADNQSIRYVVESGFSNEQRPVEAAAN